MRNCILLLIGLAVAGCSTTETRRQVELEAAMPRAQGLGAFAGNCLFFCSVTATFTQGDSATTDPEAARMKSKSTDEYKHKGPAP